MDRDLVEALANYLRSNGEGSLVSITSHLPQYRDLAMDHDTLGWDNFLEARVAKKLFILMNESLAASGSHMRLLTWAKH